ncbi:hypothetical protein AYO21_01008 [Fonsecaea monophora]|uniref:BZIP domain-containing protein n=1 Tax=Fonsecaea monophora TaxID=254056 RepID=A0A177FJT8_9EURO|nr:hypothetical protein AYO21_01008 [Fonsecaea monophora]OAG44518.1 hypothetical protein AYO21_01008 [Fonsecaea monophora]
MGSYTPVEMSAQGSALRPDSSFPPIAIDPSRSVPPMEAPQAKRNTINQRRCRARRQVYIEDLERRIREHEAQGVQATAEVQLAARRVAEENRALREEVKALREQNEILQRSLAGRSSGFPQREDKVDGPSCDDGRRKIRRTGPTRKSRVFDGKTFAQGTPFTVMPAPPSQLREIAAKPTSNKMTNSTTTVFSSRPPSFVSGPPPSSFSVHDVAAVNGQTHEDRMWTPLVEEVDYTPALMPSPPSSNFATSDLEISSTARHPSSTPSPTVSPAPYRQRLCEPPLTANSTPCLEAALIIASMRGVPCDDVKMETEILPELGCHGPLARPQCIAPEACRMDNREHNMRRSEDISTTATGGDEPSSDLSRCVVDNGRLFGILAREG